LFGIFLLLCQVLQGGMAAAMPCAGDFNDFVACDVIRAGSAGAVHVRAAGPRGNPAPTHCAFCDSGACRMTHSPALSIALAPIPGTLRQSVASPQLRVAHITAPFERILRPPK
jgi:hypothetical protein